MRLLHVAYLAREHDRVVWVSPCVGQHRQLMLYYIFVVDVQHPGGYRRVGPAIVMRRDWPQTVADNYCFLKFPVHRLPTYSSDFFTVMSVQRV